MGGEQNGDSAPVLMVSTGGPGRLLRAGASYSLGRDPRSDIVFDDPRVSWRHAVLRLDSGGWLLEDAGSKNGIFAGTQRVTRMWIAGDCLARLADGQDGPPLWCRLAVNAGNGAAIHAPCVLASHSPIAPSQRVGIPSEALTTA